MHFFTIQFILNSSSYYLRHKCKHVFVSVSDVTRFSLNMIPFLYRFATQRKIIDHVIYWAAPQKGGNLIFDGGNLIFTSRLPDG